MRRWLPEPWSPPQRGVVLALLIAVLGYTCIRLMLNPTYVSDPQPEVPARAGDLADRIDPNSATWSDWAALPNIGEKRGRDIVDYRVNFEAAHPGQRAFNTPQDLIAIPGIGPATVQQLEPYLIFPHQTPPAATTAPAHQ